VTIVDSTAEVLAFLHLFKRLAWQCTGGWRLAGKDAMRISLCGERAEE